MDNSFEAPQRPASSVVSSIVERAKQAFSGHGYQQIQQASLPAWKEDRV